MSFAGLEDLKPMARGTGSGYPNKVPFANTPAGIAFGLRFNYPERTNVGVNRVPMRYIGTFGPTHKWAGHYIEIKEYDYDHARLRMQQVFGNDWLYVYSADYNHTAEENAEVRKHGYKKITAEMLRDAAIEAAKPFNILEGVL